MKFELGNLVVTKAALAAINDTDAALSVRKHMSGDWGDVCKEDKAWNDAAVVDGGRIQSAYHDRNGVEFWIVTEATRETTTILLPADY